MLSVSFGKMLKKLTQALTSNIGLKITYLTLQPGPLTKILANIKSILKTLQHYIYLKTLQKTNSRVKKYKYHPTFKHIFTKKTITQEASSLLFFSRKLSGDIILSIILMIVSFQINFNCTFFQAASVQHQSQ